MAFGAVAAPVTYYAFASGLLQGPLFPDFTGCQETSSSSLILFACKTKGPVETAKLLVWVFVAGFFERFVPDVLEGGGVRAARASQSGPTPEPERLNLRQGDA